MNIKCIAMGLGVLTLAACGNNAQDPEKLKGLSFIAQSNNTPITLTFAPDANRINGQVVNLYNASYTARGNKITFGDVLSTMMMGPMDAMTTEQEYFQFMATVEKYDLNGDTLTLYGSDGQTMVFNQTGAGDIATTETETVESETVIETVSE
ncbi:MAG: META domain-containing protein [Muribaculaceae bacterium]|nr:META domain-containing protein [Muribaculaceae bacterium]